MRPLSNLLQNRKLVDFFIIFGVFAMWMMCIGPILLVGLGVVFTAFQQGLEIPWESLTINHWLSIGYLEYYFYLQFLVPF